MSDLHAQIMNIQSNKRDQNKAIDEAMKTWRTYNEILVAVYQRGHRDARHEAAELSLEKDREIARLTSEFEKAKQLNTEWGYRYSELEAEVERLSGDLNRWAENAETIAADRAQWKAKAETSEAEVARLREVVSQCEAIAVDHMNLLEAQGWTRHQASEIAITKTMLENIREALATRQG